MDLSRNWLFINNKNQLKIQKTKIFFAGTGLGSQIAINLARLGFKNFILADGDTFSESNLNRQHCFKKDINKNKAIVTKKYILEINPKSKVEVYPNFLKKKQLEKFIKKSDIIINCIDFDSKEYLECHRLCKKYKKTEIFVINIGFGSIVSVSNKNTIEFSSFLKEKNFTLLKNKLLGFFIENYCSKNSQKKLEEYYLKLKENPQLPEPQIISGCLASSFLTSKVIVDIITNNKDLILFPKAYSIDLN